MNVVQHHLPCEDCGSQDALSEYEDNTYCFSCQKSTRTNGRGIINSIKKGQFEDDHKGEIRLPSDFDFYIPPKRLEWLNKYGILPEQIEKYHIGYSQYLDRVIIPSYEGTTLLGWQGRGFKQGAPKYWQYANNKPPYFRNHVNSNIMVLVEDMLSAITLDPLIGAMAICGTNLTRVSTKALIDTHPDVVLVWMDRDTAGQNAIRTILSHISWIFPRVIGLFNIKEPKLLSIDEREQVLYDFIH